ncbi:hypothetical protein [Knoellia subterranea]|uniref:Uncharacterized protein n=1 Tax=Knoellia subterranea KCTC 19937 TaxID=1385521 RepID=A0A0A0JKY5_9MICO|nr:hypothetical protein [Knoellia subterranea]KGN37414.1 hypothetical protein N803_13500 [Knoellia subterranea KCTC 19937]
MNAVVTPMLTLAHALPMSPSPSPSPSAALDGTPSQQAAPGLWAFVAFLFLAIALWLLMRNMNSRLRRMSYRAKAAEKEAGAGPEGDPAKDTAKDTAAQDDAEGQDSGESDNSGR